MHAGAIPAYRSHARGAPSRRDARFPEFLSIYQASNEEIHMQTHLLNDFAPSGNARELMPPWMRRARAALAVLGLLAVNVLVVSCGSGGGGDGSSAGLSPQGASGVSPQIVSGVAATGAPMAGGQVSIRDSSSVRNEKVGDIDANGAFAVDVADMTAPFILKATGTVDGVSRTLFSFADKPGTANINPLSNAAVANAAGVDDPAELFDKSDSDTLDKIKSVMPAAMPNTVAILQVKLKPLLDEFSASNFNPVSDQFSANHEGLDAVFDNVKVVIANGILTITNVDTGAVLFTAQVKEKDLEHGLFTDKHEDVPKHGRPRPAAPTGVTTVGGPGPDQVTVSWDPVPGATSYDLFYTTKSKAADDEDHEGEDSKKRVKNVTSPFVVSGLDPSTTYFFILRARIDGRKGPRSVEVAGSPSSTTPSSTTTTTTTTTTTAPATSTTAATSSTTGATTSTTAAATSTTAATTSTTAAPTTTTAAPTTTTAAPTTTTTTTTASTTTTTLAINGAALYTTNCSGCHGPLATSAFRGASVANINAGISGVTSMRNSILATNGGVPLTQAQITAISAALQ